MRRKILFQREEYLFITIPGEEGGAIATREQFENFEPSAAFLNPSGVIVQFGTIIGSKEDITFLEEE